MSSLTRPIQVLSLFTLFDIHRYYRALLQHWLARFWMWKAVHDAWIRARMLHWFVMFIYSNDLHMLVVEWLVAFIVLRWVTNKSAVLSLLCA